MPEIPLVASKNQNRISATSYPTKCPTYIAFSVNETVDEPTTAADVCGNSQSDPNRMMNYSLSSGSSTTSKITLVNNISWEQNFNIEAPSISDVKIDIPCENDGGDIVLMAGNTEIAPVIHDNDNNNARPCVVVFKKRNKSGKQFTKRLSRERLKKRVQNAKVTRNNRFKCRKFKNAIFKKLHDHCKDLDCEDLSRLVITSKMLKKVSAKEKLLDKPSLNEKIQSAEVNCVRQPLTGSIGKRSYIINATKHSISPRNSMPLKIKEHYSIASVNSLLKVSSDITPYKRDIINVSVAVANNTKQQNNTIEQMNSKINETYFPGFQTHIIPIDISNPSTGSKITLTPRETSNDQRSLNEYKLSTGTLKKYSDKKYSFISNESDTYELGRYSSDFTDSLFTSASTLVSKSDTLLRSQNICTDDICFEALANHNLTKPTEAKDVLETINNFGIFPKKASTSYTIDPETGTNKVIVINNLGNSQEINANSQTKRDNHALQSLSKNVLKKLCNYKNSGAALPTNTRLPNKATIENAETNNEVRDENDGYLKSVAEIWDKLSSVLDVAVKRLEESLSDKIITELKVVLPDILNTFNTKGKQIVEDNSKCYQCDLIQNQMLDELVLKISVEPKVSSKTSIQKLKEPAKARDGLDVLEHSKTEVVTIDLDKGDNISASGTKPYVENEVLVSGKLKDLVLKPVLFVKENMIVIASVPVFMLTVFSLYCVIVYCAQLAKS